MDKKQKLKLFFNLESTSIFRYFFEQFLFCCLSWIPTFIGIILRCIFYKMVCSICGFNVFRNGVILKKPKLIKFGKNSYIDHNVYNHATKNGITIGENTRIMLHTMLHEYNFRDFTNSIIDIDENTTVGPYCLIYGHGGTIIGNNVSIAGNTKILPVNHLYNDPNVPISVQGISANGIKIEDNV